MKHEKFPAMERSAYYHQAESWAQDIHHGLRASRRRAYIVAAMAAVIAMLEAVALVLLMPLKTVVPYTITVDRQTGYMELAQSLKPGPLAKDAAVTQSFLIQYVLARETFDVSDLQENYQKVAAWTAGPARDFYIASMQRSNPSSPENINSAGTVVKIVVKNVSFLSPGTALVRFDAERHAGSQPSDRQPYSAVIAFRTSGAPMRAQDRVFNPLGFEVTSYRRDAETTGPVAGAGVAR